MIDQKSLEQFNQIYKQTYQKILKFVICKCSNIEDVNDIIQETYLEFYKILCKNHNKIENVQKYLIGIANHKVKKHYNVLYRFKTISIFSKNNENLDIEDTLTDIGELEQIVFHKTELEKIWKFLKQKNIDIMKIFYLYYYCDFTIKEIAQQLNRKESYIKTCLYRTLKEIQEKFERDM